MPELDNPWSWPWDHRCIVENADESPFHLGVDEHGDLLVASKTGAVGTIGPDAIRDWLREARAEYREAVLEEASADA